MQTTAFGVAYLETSFEVLIGTYATAQLAAEHHAGYEAVEANVLSAGWLASVHPSTPGYNDPSLPTFSKAYLKPKGQA